MKKFYLLAAAALVGVTAQAQSTVTEDWEINDPFEWSDYNDAGGVTIIGATATINDFSLNICGLPQSPAGEFQPVTLSNGGILKYFDNPEAAYPSGDDYPDYADYLGATAIPQDIVIDGYGNEIYYDSYCTVGGTITGWGDLTIYVSNKTTLNFVLANTLNTATPAFIGTIYVKSLDGYACDTINVGTSFRPGYYNITADGVVETGVLGTKAYQRCSSKFDLTGIAGVVWNQSGANSQLIPPIVGVCEIHTANYPYVNGFFDAFGNDRGEFAYDATWTGGSTGYDYEMYGGSLVYRGINNQDGRYAYVRSSAHIYFNNDPETPSFSGFVNDFSQRGTGITGGTGWADFNYSPNSRANTFSSGYPYTEVGTMKWKGFYLNSGNIVRYDFDGDKSDIIEVTDTYRFFSGRNDVYIGLKGDYFQSAVPGNYKVINAVNLDAGYTTVLDTIGYQVWDNNGTTYVIRSVRGGEQVVSAETGETFIAQPGDSIGVATFGQLEPKYGATCMDGNRPHWVIKEWGVGSYSDGKSTDEQYIGLKRDDYDGTYVINPDEIGTWARGAEGYQADSLAWEKVWADFVAAHPVSDSRVAVTPDDPSVIPGTVTDSIFLTFSYVHTNDGIVGQHQWNNANANAAYTTYPYAGALTYAYYYYSNNTIYLNQSGGIVNAGGDTIAEYNWKAVTLPRTLYSGKMETIVTDEEGNQTTELVNDPATAYTSYATDKIAIIGANQDVTLYWFDFTNYMTKGIIALCYEKLDFYGNVTETNANAQGACTDEKIVNSNEILELKTLLKETKAVASRQIIGLDGKRLNTYAKGFNVVTTKYTDGSVETKKVFFVE